MIIVAHYTSYNIPVCDIGITIAVDNTGTAVEQTDNATHVLRSTDGAAVAADVGIAVIIRRHGTFGCQYSAVVYTCTACRLTADSADVACGRTATDVDIVKDDILDGSAIGCGKKWIR